MDHGEAAESFVPSFAAATLPVALAMTCMHPEKNHAAVRPRYAKLLHMFQAATCSMVWSLHLSTQQSILHIYGNEYKPWDESVMYSFWKCAGICTWMTCGATMSLKRSGPRWMSEAASPVQGRPWVRTPPAPLIDTECTGHGGILPNRGRCQRNEHALGQSMQPQLANQACKPSMHSQEEQIRRLDDQHAL